MASLTGDACPDNCGFRPRLKWRALAAAFLPALSALPGGCRSPQGNVRPSIEFTSIPNAGSGGRDRLDNIAGRVSGARAGQRVVVFARSGLWWVQPLASQPFTAIGPDSTWTNSTHLGTEYAALLVDHEYVPAATLEALPPAGGLVVAVATTVGHGLQNLEPKALSFSGYQWEIRQTPSDRGGSTNNYDPANAWTDANGWLHLRISRSPDGWNCAEIALQRSLGYGSYSATVQNVSGLEPAAVLGIFTWDDLGADQNHHEMDIEISRWGDPASKNAQYSVQPYYVPVNVVRVRAPPGSLTHSFRWGPGCVWFRTTRGSANDSQPQVVAEHASPQSDNPDLAQAFSRIEQELALEEPIDFRVIVEGRPRALHPVFRDEVYRIGREAIVDAFRHAQATRIEVGMEYAASHFRFAVRDNGRGIDPEVLRSGREGHWGLPGMRERAERIGGRLSVWSKESAGTELELLVPGHLAFPSRAPEPSSHGLAAWYRRRANTKAPETKKRETR
jgi:Histidine kinase-, DNA gyrase B-, and HSP90-like ATPase